MKILFASDLHGSASAAEKVLERLEKEGADRFFLLGDLLYHGPRNDLPDRYEPREVIRLLNESPIVPLCVRGQLRRRGGPDGAAISHYGRLRAVAGWMAGVAPL